MRGSDLGQGERLAGARLHRAAWSRLGWWEVIGGFSAVTRANVGLFVFNLPWQNIYNMKLPFKSFSSVRLN